MCPMRRPPPPPILSSTQDEKGMVLAEGPGLTDGGATTVGVLGDDPLTCRILGLLLVGAGYGARALDVCAVSEDPGAAFAGVDVVLLVPGLDDERKGDLVAAMEGNPAAAALPVLRLSTLLAASPEEGTGSVAWPWSVGNVAESIERAVIRPVPGGEAP